MEGTNQEKLRFVMRQWSTGVSIVTTQYEGEQQGMTVSSFTSVSLDPQVVIISLANSARTHDMILKSSVFAITVLSDTQEYISTLFAGQATESDDRFAGLKTESLSTGSPIIAGNLAYLDCKVISVQEFGSNSLFIGEVVETRIGEGGKPLIYYNQQYHKLQE